MNEKIRIFGTIAVSIAVIGAFFVALFWSFLTHDEGMKNLTAGAAVAMAGTAVNWWMGSSKGSEKKDDTIAAAAAAAPPPPPPRVP